MFFALPHRPWASPPKRFRTLWAVAALALLAGAAGANTSPRAAKPRWPAAVEKALAQAQVPASAVAVLVVDVNGQRAPRLSHRAGEAMNPA